MNIGQHLVKLRANDTFSSHSALCCGTIFMCHPVFNHWFQSISVYSTVHQKFCVPVYCTLTVVRQSSSSASTFDSVSVTVVTPLATRLISLQNIAQHIQKNPNGTDTLQKLHHAFSAPCLLHFVIRLITVPKITSHSCQCPSFTDSVTGDMLY